MFRRLIVILSAHFLATCTIFNQGNTVNIADLPVAVVSHDILFGRKRIGEAESLK